jgi:hypothetical protein
MTASPFLLVVLRFEGKLGGNSSAHELYSRQNKKEKRA